MNIYKFKIEVKSKKKTTDMEKATIECFKRDSTKRAKYHDYVMGEWDKEAAKTKIIFTDEQVLAVVHEDQTKYYIAKVRANDDPKKIQYDVLVISNAEKINDSIKQVYSSLRKKLKGFKISISDNLAYLFIIEKNDIFMTDLAIKATVVVKGLDLGIREKIRLIAMIVLTIIFGIYTKQTLSQDANAIWVSLFASTLVWIITELLVKIHITKELEVNDLSNCFKKQQQYEEPETPDVLKTPTITSWEA